MYLGAFSSADRKQTKHNETENCGVCFIFVFCCLILGFFFSVLHYLHIGVSKQEQPQTSPVCILMLRCACFCDAFSCSGSFSSFFPLPFKKIQTNDPLFSLGRRERLTLKCVSSYCFHLLAPAGCCHKSSYFPGSVCIPSLPVYPPSIKHLQH